VSSEPAHRANFIGVSHNESRRGLWPTDDESREAPWDSEAVVKTWTGRGGTGDTQPSGRAARRGPDVQIRTADDSHELRSIEELLAGIWAAPSDRPLLSAEVLTAFVQTGNYVAGAWVEGQLVGASVGFFGYEGKHQVLHSHVTGVLPALQGAGLGFALKQHQRRWALERSIYSITWTFDPLVRRNAWFNLMKLGGEVAAYHPNFYGAMIDGINGQDETDRCVVRWSLERQTAARNLAAPSGPRRDRDDSSVIALSEGAGGRPDVANDPGALAAARRVSCWIPSDVLAMRELDPPLHRAWRLALRSSMGVAIQSGLVATGITKDGWYTLERRDELEDSAEPGAPR
jgi:predicted GNAT superfamily acetyltransferase